MRISDWEFRRVLFRSLVKTAAETRYGTPLPPRVRKLMGNELRLIRRRNYVCYFLTVYNLVRFARAQNPPILCQGRGSAAHSIVCFLLGVSSVEPMKTALLFSRFKIVRESCRDSVCQSVSI